MKKVTKSFCFLLAMLLLLSLLGCGKKASKSDKKPSVADEETESVDMMSYIGTWQGSDHDMENIVHYLIFDENGYWNVYINYATLKRAIKQMPERYVSFKITFEGEQPRNNSEHTGCYYEFVPYGKDVFFMDDDGKVICESMKDVSFTKVSEEAGEPSGVVREQARDLFDRVLIAADQESKESAVE